MKRIIAVVLAVILLAAGLGGLVYAQDAHVPMTGQKLVGVGTHGSYTGEAGIETYAFLAFRITNPDCVAKITLEQVSIIRTDGEVIYEGPLRLGGPDGELAPMPMEPHKVYVINLRHYVGASEAEAYG